MSIVQAIFTKFIKNLDSLEIHLLVPFEVQYKPYNWLSN